MLVHGACHGTWCWDRLLPRLAARGLIAEAIDPAGSGNDPTPAEEVSMGLWGETVAKKLEYFDMPAVLVGHSLGGMVITDAAGLVPERIRDLNYLFALLPQDGETSGGLYGSFPPEENHVELVTSEDGTTVVFEPSSLKKVLYSDCSDADIVFAASPIRPVPVQTFAQLATISQAAKSIPRTS